MGDRKKLIAQADEQSCGREDKKHDLSPILEDGPQRCIESPHCLHHLILPYGWEGTCRPDRPRLLTTMASAATMSTTTMPYASCRLRRSASQPSRRGAVSNAVPTPIET